MNTLKADKHVTSSTHPLHDCGVHGHDLGQALDGPGPQGHGRLFTYTQYIRKVEVKGPRKGSRWGQTPRDQCGVFERQAGGQFVGPETRTTSYCDVLSSPGDEAIRFHVPRRAHFRLFQISRQPPGNIHLPLTDTSQTRKQLTPPCFVQCQTTHFARETTHFARVTTHFTRMTTHFARVTTHFTRVATNFTCETTHFARVTAIGPV